jgi:putative acetyltransferase
MNGFTIRPWRAGDSDELLLVFRRSVREVASRDYAPAQIEAWATGPDDFARRMGMRTTFVAEANGRLLGFVQFEPPDHIDMAYVHPDYQRLGVATALLAAAEEESRRLGTKVLHLEASITARPFFERRGYGQAVAQVVRFRGQDFVNFRMSKQI